MAVSNDVLGAVVVAMTLDIVITSGAAGSTYVHVGVVIAIAKLIPPQLNCTNATWKTCKRQAWSVCVVRSAKCELGGHHLNVNLR